MKQLFKLLFLSFFALAIVGCTEPQGGDDPEIVDPEEPEKEDPEEPEEENPNKDAIIYSPSNRSTPYVPITVMRTSKTNKGAKPDTPEKNTRIVKNMTEFKAGTAEEYYANSNKYGSRTDKMGTATGRYHTEKIDGRWWIVDPEGYLNIQRGLTSVNYDQGNANAGAWAAKWSSVNGWLTDLYADFQDLGFNATGAFSKDSDCGYEGLMAFDKTASNPLTVAPSLGFLSAFRKNSTYNTISYKYFPDGSSDDKFEAALAFYPGWNDFCKYYIEKEIAAYEADPNVIGFFSDNELQWNSMSLNILDKFLTIKDKTNPAYIAAANFMTENGSTATSTPTKAMREAFAGVAADAYYSGVRLALDELGYKILYLGTRLHGTPKQIKAVIEAAAKSCDVISINYYSRWSVEYTGTTENDVAIVTDYWEAVDAPFLVSEFYVKGVDGAELSNSTVTNTDGAGWLVSTQEERGYWYQHFTLGLLESTHCVGWHWFRYQDDEEANRGFYDRNFNQWTTLSDYAKELNYNTYNLIDYFEKH